MVLASAVPRLNNNNNINNNINTPGRGFSGSDLAILGENPQACVMSGASTEPRSGQVDPGSSPAWLCRAT